MGSCWNLYPGLGCVVVGGFAVFTEENVAGGTVMGIVGAGVYPEYVAILPTG